ncbi:hypothetical protein GUITHDRAFT_146511 [Guillardia theta CCMP2712]|uniref:Uncharacterized protein n=1 Tax=Guillardia theta (strain CCMP2712) TaxID=905079 RepID=L1IGM2_GUITC|nr:hypothetical protein GUITHDRAFT_146511 [Guillardia theta CCMP2712]EKX35406.1 hypothetical protein GUITHDRAFT_146511 [Guillardia theta CCMP2712]|eukprot:XP_005822386.1 hypothetical protein GUITHDRAFT_146511 [Guillardia theta CCMP2712]
MQLTQFIDHHISRPISASLLHPEDSRDLLEEDSSLTLERCKDSPKLPPPTRFRKGQRQQAAEGTASQSSRRHYRREWSRQVGRQIMGSADMKRMELESKGG